MTRDDQVRAIATDLKIRARIVALKPLNRSFVDISTLELAIGWPVLPVWRKRARAPMRDWDEPRPRGIDWETIQCVDKALREIEIGRLPETAWELEVYAKAYAAGIVCRPLRTN
jgi:hypothetical protein